MGSMIDYINYILGEPGQPVYKSGYQNETALVRVKLVL